MKPKRSLLLLVCFFIASCNSNPKQNLVQPEPTETISVATITTLPSSTPTPVPNSTPTTVPIYTEISCAPSDNPYAEIPEMYAHEKPYMPNIPISQICTIEGSVSRGQVYKHQIAENLALCLVPDSIGWYLVISDLQPGNCENRSDHIVNFANMLTPPFHGNTTFFIWGPYFRNEDNTEYSDDSYKRYMNFVFSRDDYNTVYYSKACSMWGFASDCIRATQTSTEIEVPRTRGILTITELELGNLVPNEHAWIEYMEFKFEFYMADK